ncbi:hypothetical protein B0H13DRAFT_1586779, partial [Mycena leptocephala]
CERPSCGKSITHLSSHRRTHTGKRPYKFESPGCSMTFAWRDVRVRHKKTRNTGVRAH